jgi:hypothetical protein
MHVFEFRELTPAIAVRSAAFIRNKAARSRFCLSSGADTMSDYRAYFVGADGHFKHAIPLDCPSDDVAIEQTKQLLDDEDIELWQRARKVATLEHKPHTAGGN